MKIYKCAVTGDELFTDAKKIVEVDGFYKIEGKNVSRACGIDDKLIGGNASAEEAAEGTDDAAVQGIDLVIDNRYNDSGFGKKKEYQLYMKDYIKALKDKKKPEDVAAFDAEILKSFKVAAEWFKDLDFYTTESMDPEGIMPFVKWEVPEGKTDDTPFFYYYKIGVVEEKV